MKTVLLPLALFTVFAQAAPLEQAFNKIHKAYEATLIDQKITLRLDIVDKGVSVAGVDRNYKGAASVAAIGVNRALVSKSEFNETVWTVILCHELGHILGGAPYTQTNPDDGGEISAEGQADYFAAAKCLRTLWSDGAENSKVVKAIDSKTVSKIKSQGCRSDQCVRVVYSGFKTLELLYDDEKLYLDRRSKEVVESTRQDRTALAGQCRVDIFLAGAVCEVSPSVPFSPSNQVDGACIQGPGARPACWFAPYNLRGTFNLGPSLQSIQPVENGFESCWP